MAFGVARISCSFAQRQRRLSIQLGAEELPVRVQGPVSATAPASGGSRGDKPQGAGHRRYCCRFRHAMPRPSPVEVFSRYARPAVLMGSNGTHTEISGCENLLLLFGNLPSCSSGPGLSPYQSFMASLRQDRRDQQIVT